MPDVSAEEFKAAMGSFVSGVTIITTIDDRGVPYGLTATAFSSVSKDPPQCLVCIAHSAEAYPVVSSQGRFAVNLLSAAQDPLSGQFAASGTDKFAGVSWAAGAATGCPLIPGALATLECEVAQLHEVGDHGLFVGRLRSVAVHEASPLVYFRGAYGHFSPTGRG